MRFSGVRSLARGWRSGRGNLSAGLTFAKPRAHVTPGTSPGKRSALGAAESCLAGMVRPSRQEMEALEYAPPLLAEIPPRQPAMETAANWPVSVSAERVPMLVADISLDAAHRDYPLRCAVGKRDSPAPADIVRSLHERATRPPRHHGPRVVRLPAGTPGCRRGSHGRRSAGGTGVCPSTSARPIDKTLPPQNPDHVYRVSEGQQRPDHPPDPESQPHEQGQHRGRG